MYNPVFKNKNEKKHEKSKLFYLFLRNVTNQILQ